MHFNDMEEQEAKFPAREEEREAPGKKKVLCEVTERGKIDSNGQIVYYLGVHLHAAHTQISPATGYRRSGELSSRAGLLSFRGWPVGDTDVKLTQITLQMH